MAVADDATYISALSLFLSSVLCDQCGSFVYGVPQLVFIVAYQASRIRHVAAVDKWSFSAHATKHFIDAASSFCLSLVKLLRPDRDTEIEIHFWTWAFTGKWDDRWN